MLSPLPIGLESWVRGCRPRASQRPAWRRTPRATAYAKAADSGDLNATSPKRATSSRSDSAALLPGYGNDQSRHRRSSKAHEGLGVDVPGRESTARPSCHSRWGSRGLLGVEAVNVPPGAQGRGASGAPRAPLAARAVRARARPRARARRRRAAAVLVREVRAPRAPGGRVVVRDDRYGDHGALCLGKTPPPAASPALVPAVTARWPRAVVVRPPARGALWRTHSGVNTPLEGPQEGRELVA